MTAPDIAHKVAAIGAAATWPDINGDIGDIGDALTPPQRETTGAIVIPPATEEVKPRPPQVSLLTARFEDLETHPAFSQRIDMELLQLGMHRTKYGSRMRL